MRIDTLLTHRSSMGLYTDIYFLEVFPLQCYSTSQSLWKVPGAGTLNLTPVPLFLPVRSNSCETRYRTVIFLPSHTSTDSSHPLRPLEHPSITFDPTTPVFYFYGIGKKKDNLPLFLGPVIFMIYVGSLFGILFRPAFLSWWRYHTTFLGWGPSTVLKTENGTVTGSKTTTPSRKERHPEYGVLTTHGVTLLPKKKKKTYTEHSSLNPTTFHCMWL